MSALNPPGWFKSRRLGRFSISGGAIDLQPSFVREIMAQVIVVRAEIMPFFEIDYVALCDAFAEITEGNVIPNYRPRIVDNKVVWESM